jgi:hypothetical protein
MRLKPRNKRERREGVLGFLKAADYLQRGLGFERITIGRLGQCRAHPGLLPEVGEESDGWDPMSERERGGAYHFG